MAAWGCHGDRDAKLETVSIAKASERYPSAGRGQCLAGLRGPQWVQTPVGTCPRGYLPQGVPAYTGCPWLLLLGCWEAQGTPRQLGCTPAATPSISISWGTASLLRPSLSSSPAAHTAIRRGFGSAAQEGGCHREHHASHTPRH